MSLKKMKITKYKNWYKIGKLKFETLKLAKEFLRVKNIGKL